MKTSEVLKLAAKRVEDKRDSLACVAIYYAGRFSSYEERAQRYFSEYFRPEDARPFSAWFGVDSEQANQNRRIIALCFAAAIAESEGN